MTGAKPTPRTRGKSTEQASARLEERLRPASESFRSDARPKRLTGRPGGTGTFEVRSRTVPDAVYRVEVTPERILCSCPGYAYRSGCWHVGAVALELRAERSRAAARLEEIAVELGCG